MGKGGRSRNFKPQIHFPSSLARRVVAHPNFRGLPSEASWATRAPDRVELPVFLCNPSGKMTQKFWPANFGLAPSGSLNVRAWPAHTFLFGGGGLAPDFSASRSSRRQGRRLAGRRRADAARADAAICRTPPVSAWTCLKTIRRRCHIYINSQASITESRFHRFP